MCGPNVAKRQRPVVVSLRSTKLTAALERKFSSRRARRLHYTETVSETRSLIERIHASGRPLVLAVTGGGSGCISALLQVPGASATVLEAVVPYAATALQQWLGG